MAGALRLVLGDQLSRGLSSLKDIDPKKDHVLMVEVHDETTYVKHHKQKIVLILAAMRHFADELKQEGLSVTYVKLEDKGNTGSFTGELARAIKTLKPEKIIVTEPGEYRVRAMMDEWQTQFNLPIEIRDDDRFFATPAEFKL